MLVSYPFRTWTFEMFQGLPASVEDFMAITHHKMDAWSQVQNVALRKYSFRTSQGFPSLWFRELATTFVIVWFSGTESIPSRAVTQPFNQTNGVLDRWVNKRNRTFLGLWGNSRVCDPFYNVLANRNWSELPLFHVHKMMLCTSSFPNFLLFLEGLHFFGETMCGGFWEML